MRALFGITELQSMTASPMQAARRSAVASSWATATVGSAARSKPAVASNPLRILVMTVSLGRAPRGAGCDHPLCRLLAAELCDGHHIFSLFARLPPRFRDAGGDSVRCHGSIDGLQCSPPPARLGPRPHRHGCRRLACYPWVLRVGGARWAGRGWEREDRDETSAPPFSAAGGRRR